MTDSKLRFVALSGGIDSTCLALVSPEATPVFTDTGDEFDETYAHLDKFEQVTGRKIIRIEADESLPEYIRRAKFLPNHGARFCTRMFKIEPMNAFLANYLPATLCIGLRADEPASERVGNLTDMPGLTIEYPLRTMGFTRIDCVRVCAENGLIPRKQPYMARGGCRGCFYKRLSEVVAMAHLVPEVLDELQEREEIVQDERGTYFHMFPNAGKSIREIREMVASQPTMIPLEDIYRAAANRDDVGAACGLFCDR